METTRMRSSFWPVTTSIPSGLLGSGSPSPRSARLSELRSAKPYRGDGVGAALMRAVEDAARDDGATELKLHAQTHVEPFYQQLGYETVSDEFEEAGIPHVKMRKRLDG